MDKKRKLFVRIVAVMMAALMALSVLVTIIASTATVYAATPTKEELQKLKNEQKKIKQEMEEVKSLINSQQYELAQAKGKKQVLDQQIELTEKIIENLQDQIVQYGLLIEEKELEVKSYQEEEDKQIELYKTRMRAMEENGTLSYYAIIFGARSFSDMLSRLDIVSSIMDYDKALYNNLVKAREATEAAKADLEATLAEAKSIEEETEAERASLELQMEEAAAVIDTINMTLEEQRDFYNSITADANKIKDDIVKMEKAIEEANRRVVGTGKFIWPIPDNVSYRVTCKFGPRNINVPGASTNHMGIDIGVAYGAKILACDRGTVVAATHSESYGYYVTISHGNGYTTLYAHMSKLNVKKGDVVQKGAVIGYAGSTGISSGPHLHLEIWKNGVRVDPLGFYDKKTIKF